jgi:excisionase family DNA binding protein
MFKVESIDNVFTSAQPREKHEEATMTTEQIQATTVLSIPEAAAILKVHVDTVRALIRSGRLHAKRLGKQRAIRVPFKSIQTYLESEDD